MHYSVIVVQVEHEDVQISVEYTMHVSQHCYLIECRVRQSEIQQPADFFFS